MALVKILGRDPSKILSLKAGCPTISRHYALDIKKTTEITDLFTPMLEDYTLHIIESEV